MIAARLHARPLGWLAALAAAAWPLGGPGTAAWAAIASLRGEPLDDTSLSDAMWGIALLDPVTVLPRVAVGLVGWVALSGISLDALDGKGWGAGALDRLTRTRGISLMVTSFSFGIPIFVCAQMLTRGIVPALASLGVAIALAGATAWMAMSDRFALRAFDGAQDRRSRDDADAKWNAPYYLNTGSPGKRGGVASGADQAVTDGGVALLSGRAVALAFAWLALDTVRAAVASTFGSWAGLVVGVEIAMLGGAMWTYLFVAGRRG